MAQLEEIIYKCREGNSGAQTALYRLFSARMYGVCLRYAKDTGDAEDILQEGFLRVFTKIHQFEFKGSFEGWIRRIMVNTALEKFRKQDRLTPVEEMKIYESTEYVEETISSITAGDLMRIIQELPPRYRMVFNLFAIEGYSHQEISEMMNISEGTSKSNLSRARVILQKSVEENFGSDKKVAKKYTMTTENHFIDQLFKEKLGNFEQNPPVGLLDQINQKMVYQGKVRQMNQLKAVIGIAAAMVLIFMAGWFTMDHNQLVNNEIPQQIKQVDTPNQIVPEKNSCQSTGCQPAENYQGFHLSDNTGPINHNLFQRIPFQFSLLQPKKLLLQLSLL